MINRMSCTIGAQMWDPSSGPIRCRNDQMKLNATSPRHQMRTGLGEMCTNGSLEMKRMTSRQHGVVRSQRVENNY